MHEFKRNLHPQKLASTHIRASTVLCLVIKIVKNDQMHADITRQMMFKQNHRPDCNS